MVRTSHRDRGTLYVVLSILCVALSTHYLVFRTSYRVLGTLYGDPSTLGTNPGLLPRTLYVVRRTHTLYEVPSTLDNSLRVQGL